MDTGKEDIRIKGEGQRQRTLVEQREKGAENDQVFEWEQTRCIKEKRQKGGGTRRNGQWN